MTWQPMKAPEGVLAVHPIQEASVPLVRFDRTRLPDLDELTLWLASIDEYGEPSSRYDACDIRTQCSGSREVDIHWLRINPCGGDCGEHSWHVDTGLKAGESSDEEPHRFGVFLGVWDW